MKKLKLNFKDIEGIEILNREQLKKILGGDNGSGVLSSCSTTCKTGKKDEYSVSISDCKGTCKATQDNGVSCSDPYEDKPC